MAAFGGDGSPLWSRIFAAPTGDVDVTSIDSSVDGSVVIGGSFAGIVRFDGHELCDDGASRPPRRPRTTRPEVRESVACDCDADWDNLFVAKIDAGGAPVWVRSVGRGSPTSRALSMAGGRVLAMVSRRVDGTPLLQPSLLSADPEGSGWRALALPPATSAGLIAQAAGGQLFLAADRTVSVLSAPDHF
jgi:hypothetical protein